MDRPDDADATGGGRSGGPLGGLRRLFGRRVRGPAMVVVVLAVLLAGEATVRVLEPNLPPPRVGDEQEGYVKAEQMDELAASGEQIDVVFVGASGIDSGIKPQLFDELNGTFTGAYNAGHVGMPPEFIGTWTERVVLERLDPKVLVVGISPPQLSARQGEEGDRLWGLSAAFDASIRDLSPGALAAVEDEASDWSALVRFRRQLRSPTGIVRAIRDRATGAENPLEGTNARDVKPREVWEDLVGPYGDMRLYAESPEEVTLDPEMAARYEAWHEGGYRISGVRSILERLDRRVPVVVLVPPIDLATLERSGMDPNLWDDALAALAETTDELGIPLVDWTHVVYDPLEFHDKGHLATSGALHLTSDFAHELDQICARGELRACRPAG